MLFIASFWLRFYLCFPCAFLCTSVEFDWLSVLIWKCSFLLPPAFILLPICSTPVFNWLTPTSSKWSSLFYLHSVPDCKVHSALLCLSFLCFWISVLPEFLDDSRAVFFWFEHSLNPLFPYILASCMFCNWLSSLQHTWYKVAYNRYNLLHRIASLTQKPLYWLGKTT